MRKAFKLTLPDARSWGFKLQVPIGVVSLSSLVLASLNKFFSRFDSAHRLRHVEPKCSITETDFSSFDSIAARPRGLLLKVVHAFVRVSDAR